MNIVPHEQEDKAEIDKLKRQEWREKAFGCDVSTSGLHNYMTVSTVISAKSQNVSQIMCKYCFHCVSIAQAMRKD